MSKDCEEPAEGDSIDCHLQQVGMGGLNCRAAKQTGGKNTTNEVTPTMCFNCEVGSIFRDVGCDAPLPKLKVLQYRGNPERLQIEHIFCKIRKRYTTLEYCTTCSLASAETTRQVVTATRGLFQTHGFSSAYKDIEKAREAFRDGKFERVITHSISCAESALRIIHDETGTELPSSTTLTNLWKSAKDILRVDEMSEGDQTLTALLGSLTGGIMHLAGLRNSLSDAHGRGSVPPSVSETIAELAINAASTVATFAVRRFHTIQRHKDEQ